VIVYYGFLIAASALYSIQFVFYTKYQKTAGNSLLSAVRFALGFNTVAFVAAWLANGLRIEVTAFAATLAGVTALILVAFSYASVKALARANLAVYSMFAMLGGMLVPFAAGILFWGEELSAQKMVCCLLVVAALFVNVPKEASVRSGIRYYILIFFLNGFGGVVSKLHQLGVGYNVSSEGFIALYGAFGVVLCLLLCVFLRWQAGVERSRETGDEQVSEGRESEALLVSWVALLCMLGYGVVNWGGNLLSLYAMLHLHASVQFPMVTGAVLILSTLASFLIGEKPRKRTVLSVGLAILGLMALGM